MWREEKWAISPPSPPPSNCVIPPCEAEGKEPVESSQDSHIITTTASQTLATTSRTRKVCCPRPISTKRTPRIPSQIQTLARRSTLDDANHAVGCPPSQLWKEGSTRNQNRVSTSRHNDWRVKTPREAGVDGVAGWQRQRPWSV